MHFGSRCEMIKTGKKSSATNVIKLKPKERQKLKQKKEITAKFKQSNTWLPLQKEWKSQGRNVISSIKGQYWGWDLHLRQTSNTLTHRCYQSRNLYSSYVLGSWEIITED